MTSLFLDIAPVVATFHAAGDSTSYRVFTPIVRFLAAHIDARVVVSKDALDLASRYLPGEYETLFNGVEIERYGAAEPFKADGPTIFFCGRHEERKGLGVLLDAIASLPPEVRCWVASEGPETASLRARYAGDPRTAVVSAATCAFESLLAFSRFSAVVVTPLSCEVVRPGICADVSARRSALSIAFSWSEVSEPTCVLVSEATCDVVRV